MVSVSVTKQSNYPVEIRKLKEEVRNFFVKNGIVSDAEVSVAMVGEKKMLELGKKYLNDKKLHNVFSFTSDEIKNSFVFPPDNIIHLGEIVICYPVAFNEAQKEGKLIQEKVTELVEHGALHLLGIHHE